VRDARVHFATLIYVERPDDAPSDIEPPRWPDEPPGSPSLVSLCALQFQPSGGGAGSALASGAATSVPEAATPAARAAVAVRLPVIMRVPLRGISELRKERTGGRYGAPLLAVT
jgi:hypothetical protein